jgi:hypothetical protein
MIVMRVDPRCCALRLRMRCSRGVVSGEAARTKPFPLSWMMRSLQSVPGRYRYGVARE